MTSNKDRTLRTLYRKCEKLTAYHTPSAYCPRQFDIAWQEYRDEWNNPDGWDSVTEEANAT